MGLGFGAGVTQSGDYYFGVGVLVDVSGGTNTINNNSGGTMQAIVTGSGQAFGVGLYAEASAVTINNSGTMDGEVQNHDGMAAGVYATGVVNATNNAGAAWSATAPYYAAGIYSSGGGEQTIVNNGTIKATATGATQGSNSNQAYCAGIDVFTYDANHTSPIYVVNNGSITISCTGGTNNTASCAQLWAEQSAMTFINNGILSASVVGSQGSADGMYIGADNGDCTFYNTGTINNGGGPGGQGVWIENDSAVGDIHFCNSGTIASGEPFAVSIANYADGPYGSAYVTNTGTISGGWFGLGWPGPITFIDSGDILTGLAWLGGPSNVNVYISGLPTIQPALGAGSGSNTLVFNLTGTLQQVNGSSASGTNLSAFNLGLLGSGSIVVSGKTYRWSNFTNVSGTITAPVTLLTGPTNLSTTVASISQANLTWNALANATNYNVKRSLTSGGPYTTIASGVATTNFTDNAAFVCLEYYYVVSAMVGGVETANSAEVALRHPKLAGTIIGTPGSYNDSGNTITNVFDNNLSTFFDAPIANGAWVGLDFGADVSNVITKINYCPCSGFESRMDNGIFQGANQANFSDAVTLFTVTTQPATGVFTSASITNTSGFRYVRYLSPNGGYGNVAELQFYGNLAGAQVPLPPAPSLTATAVSSDQINLVWNGVTDAASYVVERSLTNGGPYVIIATGWTMTNYTDVGLAGGTAYFYVVCGVNAGGNGANSIQASATTTLSAPVGLTAAAVSTNQISLTWNVVTNATGYNVKRSLINGGPYANIASGVTATNYLDTGLVSGATYFYVVSAVFGGGETPNSAQASATLIPATGVFWTGAVNGTWDTATANWRSNGVPAVFTVGDTAVFDDTALSNSTINLSAPGTPAAVFANNSALTFSIGGSAIAGTGSLAKSGTGTFILLSANTYSGGTILNAGTLQIGSGSAQLLGTELGTGAVTNNGGSLFFNSSGSSTPITYAPSFVLYGGTVSSEDGFMRLATGSGATITVNGSTTLQREWGHVTGKYLALNGILQGAVVLTLQGFAGNTGEGSSIWINNNNNTYSGTVTVNANTGASGCFALGVGANNALQSATVNLSGTRRGMIRPSPMEASCLRPGSRLRFSGHCPAMAILRWPICQATR